MSDKHPFRIYTQCLDGKHFIGTGDAIAVELLREQCSNIVTEDIELPDVTQKSIFGDPANHIEVDKTDSELRNIYLAKRKARNLMFDTLAACGIGVF